MKKLKLLTDRDIKVLEMWNTATSIDGEDITTKLQNLSELWMNNIIDESVYQCGKRLDEILREHDK